MRMIRWWDCRSSPHHHPLWCRVSRNALCLLLCDISRYALIGRIFNKNSPMRGESELEYQSCPGMRVDARPIILLLLSMLLLSQRPSPSLHPQELSSLSFPGGSSLILQGKSAMIFTARSATIFHETAVLRIVFSIYRIY